MNISTLLSWFKGSNQRRTRLLAILISLSLSLPTLGQAQVPDWPDLYDPFTMLDFHVELDSGDYNTILNDLTYDIEVPALLWANGEAPILVSIRRKSATAFPSDGAPFKVSFKIDINEYTDEDEFGNDICEPGSPPGAVCVGKWHGVKKLSLENGDDDNVLSEGLAWYVQRLASSDNYITGYASWITLTVHTTGASTQTIDNGVYVNVAQRDKQFLKNHGLWEGSDDTWLIKHSGTFDPEIKEAPEDEFGEEIASPNDVDLNFKPFENCPRRGNTCDPQPDDVAFEAILSAEINMESMLTQAAVGAYINGVDDLIAKAKNFYIVDYSDTLQDTLGFQREYIPWDLDSTFAGEGIDISIYDRKKGGKGSQYENLVIGHPDFREDYNAIMQDLLDGVLDKDDLVADLEAICSVICAAVNADPHNALGDSAEYVIGQLQTYVLNRDADIRAQLPAPPPPPLQDVVSLHLNDLSGSSASAPRNRWSATATVSTHNFSHTAADDGATVSGSFSTGGSGSCVTAGGSCSITKSGIKGNKSSTTFTVTDITVSGGWYKADLNEVVPASVTINKPL